MRFRQLTLAALLAAVAFAGLAQAQYVFSLPPSFYGTTIPILNSDLSSNTSIALKPDLIGVYYLPAYDKYYVLSATPQNTVTVVDGNSLTAFKNVSLGDQVRLAEVTPDGRRLLVLGTKMFVVDGSSDVSLVPAGIDVGSSPVDVVVSRDSRKAYVLSAESRRISVVDLSTLAVVQTASYEGTGRNLGLHPNGDLYLTRRNVVVVYDSETLEVKREISLTGLPLKPAFSADGRYLIAPDGSATPGLEPDATAILIDLEEPNDFTAVTKVTQRNPLTNAVEAVDRIYITDIGEAYGLSQGRGVVLRFTWPMLAATVVELFPGDGGTTEVTALGVTSEYPKASSLYFVKGQTLGRYRLDTRETVATREGFLGKIAVVERPSSGPVQTMLRFNGAQRGALGARLKPLIVRAFDAAGKPVFNQTITFSTEAEGLTIENAAARTNKDGYAWAIVTLPSVDGRFVVTATAPSGVQQSFVVTAGTGIPPGGGSGDGGDSGLLGGLFKIQGDGIIALEAIQLSTYPLIVEARDEAGNPVSGAQIQWSIVEGSAYNVINQLATLSSTTNDQGRAFNVVAGAFPIPADKSYVVTKIRATWGDYSTVFTVLSMKQGAPAPRLEWLTPSSFDLQLTAGAGDTVPGAIQLRALVQGGTQSGSPFVGLGMRVFAARNGVEVNPTEGPTAKCKGGLVLADETGLIKCDLVVGPLQGTVPLIVQVGGWWESSINLTVTQGSPRTIQIVQGNNQSGDPNTNLPQALIAAVLNGAGGPVSSTPVAWTVEPAGAATLVNASQTTDSDGRARATVRLGNSPGPFRVRITAGSASAQFNLTVNMVAANLAKVSGDGQSGFLGEAFSQPLRVRVTDAQGQPVQNVPVNFLLLEGAATVGSPETLSNASGIAETTVTAGLTPGTIRIRVTAANVSQPVEFVLTAIRRGPQVTAANFLDYSSGRPGVGPGSLMVLTGQGIAANVNGLVTAPPFSFSYPLELAGLKVEFINPNGNRYTAPIIYVQKDGANELAVLQVPYEVQPGTVSAEVTVSGGTTRVEGIQVAPFAPGFLLNYNAGTHSVALAQRPDGSIVTVSNPARRGETIRVYMIGLGQTTPPMLTNNFGGADQRVNATVIIGLNNAGVPVTSAKAAQNLIGVYVVDFVVPPDGPTGAEVRLDAQVVGSNNQSYAAPGARLPIGN